MPPIVIFLAKSPLVKEYDLSSVKRAVSGAAPLSKEVERDFTKRMDVPEMRQGWFQIYNNYVVMNMMKVVCIIDYSFAKIRLACFGISPVN